MEFGNDPDVSGFVHFKYEPIWSHVGASQSKFHDQKKHILVLLLHQVLIEDQVLDQVLDQVQILVQVQVQDHCAGRGASS